MAINRLHESFEIMLIANPDCDKAELIKFVRDFISADQAEYKKNADSGKLTFGKYRGLTVEQVVGLPKGQSYLKWMSNQLWFEEDKFPMLYRACVEHDVIKA
tara:strand:- start:1326 stop:1631 length:306 start_codon:yes stop_codon:yes gene_type:complete